MAQYQNQRPAYYPNQNQNQWQQQRQMQGVGYAVESMQPANSGTVYAQNGAMMPAMDAMPSGQCVVPPGNTALETLKCIQNQSLNICDIWTTERLLAEGLLCWLPPALKEAIESGSKKLVPHTLYNTALINGQTTKFVNSDSTVTPKIAGVRNFAANKLDAGDDLIVLKVRLGSAVLPVGATAAQIANAEYYAVEDTNGAAGTEIQRRTSLDPFVKNAELKIKSVMEHLWDFPCTAFNNIQSDAPVGLLDLTEGFVLRAQTELTMELEQQAGSTPPANLYARLELIGFRVR